MTKDPRGRKSTYHLGSMIVGDMVTFDAPTKEDVKRIARNASQYGLRNGRFYRCSTDKVTRQITLTRIR